MSRKFVVILLMIAFVLPACTPPPETEICVEGVSFTYPGGAVDYNIANPEASAVDGPCPEVVEEGPPANRCVSLDIDLDGRDASVVLNGRGVSGENRYKLQRFEDGTVVFELGWIEFEGDSLDLFFQQPGLWRIVVQTKDGGTYYGGGCIQSLEIE